METRFARAFAGIRPERSLLVYIELEKCNSPTVKWAYPT